MNPIGMWIARARGLWNFDSTTDALLMHYPDYLLLGVAVVISARRHRLGAAGRERAGWGYQLGELWVVAEWARSTTRRTACSRGRRAS